jgi:hypothetical protein
MDNKPKKDQGSSWNDETDKLTTNPNRRQEEDQRSNVESPREGQRASRPDSGSSESPPSERDEQLHGDRQSETSRRQRQTEE